MSSSRREFVCQSLAVAGAAMVAPACTRVGSDQAGPPPLQADSGFEPGYVALEREGALAEVAETLWAGLESCEGCARKCGANRLAGETGFCSTPKTITIAGAAAHYGEERELVGSGGSGTVFFSHCNLLCCFCQNWEINHRGEGEQRSIEDLASMMLALQAKGCHNINLVTPSHVVPHIVKAVRVASRRGLRLPLVYNTGGYDNLEVIRMLDGIVDIYLPDFKYQDSQKAATYSSGASDYPEVAAAAIKEMNRQVGEVETDVHGVAQRGLILRHLVMPNNVGGTDRLVRWIAEELGPDTYLNLMDQYRPEHEAFDHPDIDRRLTSEEWQQAVAWAREAGLTNVRT